MPGSHHRLTRRRVGYLAAAAGVAAGVGLGVRAAVEEAFREPLRRSWLAGYFGAGDAGTRAAWAADYFTPQVWTTFIVPGTSFATTGVASINGRRSFYRAPVSDGSSLNVLTIPLLATATAAMNPAALKAAAGGGDVAGWTAMAQAIKALGLDSPSTVLRIGHEPNGSPYPWATSGQPDLESLYRRGWRRAHDAVAAVCPRVRFCLCLNVGLGGAAALPGHYPGDAYVDIIALDFYDYGATEITTDAGFRSAQGSLGFTDVAAFAATRGKQVGVGEWAVSQGSGLRDNPFFVQSIFGALAGLQAQYPGIVAYDSYFTDGNHNLTRNPHSAAEYRTLWTATTSSG